MRIGREENSRRDPRKIRADDGLEPPPQSHVEPVGHPVVPYESVLLPPGARLLDEVAELLRRAHFNGIAALTRLGWKPVDVQGHLRGERGVQEGQVAIPDVEVVGRDVLMVLSGGNIVSEAG